MKILFIGGIIDTNNEKRILENHENSIDNAANVFQKKVIKGLIENKCNVDIVSEPFIGAYPRKSSIKNLEKMKNSENIEYLRFNNVWGIRNISRYYSLKKYIKKNKQNLKQYDAIITYSMHTPFIKVLKNIKKISPTTVTISIVPDLPQYMNLSKKVSLIYKLLKIIDIKIINKNKKYIDQYVLLTKQMAEKMNIENEKYIVIDGISIPEKIETIKGNNDYITFMYAGTLEKKYGILNLLEAFYKIKDKKLKLIICGNGETVETIKDYTNKDNRISYLGYLDHTKVIETIKKADIMVNPRMNYEYTKYSFPSKIMEYLEEGKIVISYKLDCFEEEYEKYIFYPKEETIDSLKETMLKVAKIEEKDKKQHIEEEIKFLKDKKSAKFQTEKIIKAIEKEKK